MEKKSSFSTVPGATFFMTMSAISAESAGSLMYDGCMGLHLCDRLGSLKFMKKNDGASGALTHSGLPSPSPRMEFLTGGYLSRYSL